MDTLGRLELRDPRTWDLRAAGLLVDFRVDWDQQRRTPGYATVTARLPMTEKSIIDLVNEAKEAMEARRAFSMVARLSHETVLCHEAWLTGFSWDDDFVQVMATCLDLELLRPRIHKAPETAEVQT